MTALRHADVVIDPLTDVINAYGGNTVRLLADLADRLGVTLAYIDRATVEAHLERGLDDTEWSEVTGQFHGLDFDERVGEHGTLRTDWIESLLDQAGVPGYGYTADGQRIPSVAAWTSHDPCLHRTLRQERDTARRAYQELLDALDGDVNDGDVRDEVIHLVTAMRTYET